MEGRSVLGVRPRGHYRKLDLSGETQIVYMYGGGIGGHAGGHIPKEAALKIECFYFFDRHYAEIKIISINVNQNMSPFTYGIYK